MTERKRIEAAGKILAIRNKIGELISEMEVSGDQEKYLWDIYDSFGSWDKIASVFNVGKEDTVDEAIRQTKND